MLTQLPLDCRKRQC